MYLARWRGDRTSDSAAPAAERLRLARAPSGAAQTGRCPEHRHQLRQAAVVAAVSGVAGVARTAVAVARAAECP